MKDNRSYIIAEEFIAPIDLSNTKHKEFSKLVLNDYYEAFKYEYTEAEKKTIEIPYYKISHSGIPEIILDCSVKFELSEDAEYEKPYSIKSHIGVFEKNIDIFVPLVKEKGGDVYVKRLTLNYSTIKGEKMQYFLDINKKEEKHFAFSDKNKKEILFSLELNSSSWILPNSKS